MDYPNTIYSNSSHNIFYDLANRERGQESYTNVTKSIQ